MKRVITAQDLPESGELRVPIGTLVTPSAREVAAERGVRITEVREDQLPSAAPEKRIAVGAARRRAGSAGRSASLRRAGEEPRAGRGPRRLSVEREAQAGPRRAWPRDPRRGRL